MMLIKVKVFPNSKQREIIKKSEDSFEIKVRQKPIQGQANQAAINVLSPYLRIPQRKIRLVKGSKQRNKVFEVLS